MASGTARPALCNSAIHASGIFNMATGAEDTLLWGFSLPVHAVPVHVSIIQCFARLRSGETELLGLEGITVSYATDKPCRDLSGLLLL